MVMAPSVFKRLSIALNESRWDQAMRAFVSGDDMPGGNGVDVSGNNSLKYSAVFACARVLAETFCSVPVAEYKNDDANGREKTNATGLYDLLHAAPNSEMDAFHFAEMGLYQLNLGGNFVCKRQYSSGGDIVGLFPFEWQRVEIDRDESGLIYYKVDGKDALKYRRRQVFHVAGPSINGIVGLTPISYAAEAIKLGMQYEGFCNAFYKNGMFPSGTFEHPGRIKEEHLERLKSSLSRQWAGMKNGGKPPILEDGLKFNPIALNLVDAELLASKRFQVEDVCRFYRVPLHLVQELSRSTNNNIEHQSLEFVMYTMLPWFKRWESAINNQLLTRQQRDDGYYFEYNMSGLLRGDIKTRAEAYASARQWGYMSVNDIRRLENLNPIDNGNIYLQPVNMIEAGAQVVDDQNKDLVEEIANMLTKRGTNA